MSLLCQGALGPHGREQHFGPVVKMFKYTQKSSKTEATNGPRARGVSAEKGDIGTKSNSVSETTYTLLN